MARYDSTIRATAVKPAFLAIPLLILGLGMPAPSAVFATSLDLAGSSSGDFKIFKGDGAGGFTILGTPTGVPSTPTGLDVGDLDGDGDNDLVATYANDWAPVQVCLNNGLGSFHCTQIDGLLRETSDVAVADIDNDGHLDFFLAGGSTNSAAFVRPNRFCLNDGNNPPAFACTDFEGLNTVGAAAADLDRDGDADAVFGNINAAARLCLNDGSRPPTFTCSNLNSTNARGVTVGDVNDDGEIDVIIANSGAAGRVCLNDGLNPPSFSCQSVGAGSGPAVGDFNDDTFVDVAFTGSSNQVCFNDGHPIPAFTCTTFNTNTDAARRVRVADLDGVNGPDMVLSNGKTCLNNGSGGFTCVVNHGGTLNVVVAQLIGTVVQPVPALAIEEAIPAAEHETVDVGVALYTAGASIAATAFSVDYDQTCLAFDDTDANGDGVPDALAFHVPAGFAVTAFHDPGDGDGEIDILIADLAPPISTLADGPLVTLTFTATCSPAAGSTILAPVVFSTHPSATFGDGLAVDVAGTTTGGSVKIWPGPRGDCNGNGALSAADLVADALEIFDADGSFWADVPGGTFAGSPVGCDANDDTEVDAGDISCTVRRIFGGACGGAPLAGPFDPETSPVLGLRVGQRGKTGAVWLPVVLSRGSHDVSSVAFSLDLLADGLRFDPFDGNGDGLPDSLRFPGGRPNLVDVRYDRRDKNGELDLVLANFGAPLANGVLVEIAIQTDAKGPVGVRFSKTPAASFGDLAGRAVPGQTVDHR